MKLLGQFDETTGNKYIDFLKKEGIEVEAEGVPYDWVSGQGMSISNMDVKLFVADQDYKNSVMAIERCKLEISKRLKSESRAANKALFKLLIVVFLMVIVGTYFYMAVIIHAKL